MVSPNEGENIFQVGCFLMLVVCKLVDLNKEYSLDTIVNTLAMVKVDTQPSG